MSAVFIQVDTKADYDLLIKDYDKKGWTWRSGAGALKCKNDGWNGEGTIMFYGDGFFSAERKREDIIRIPFTHYAALNGIDLSRTATITIGDYEAKVDYSTETVMIHTQVIPFAKIEELHKLVNKATQP